MCSNFLKGLDPKAKYFISYRADIKFDLTICWSTVWGRLSLQEDWKVLELKIQDQTILYFL